MSKAKDNPLDRKVALIERRIYDVVKSFCSENYSVIHYGVYDIDPKALVYWVCLKTDSAKQILENNPDLNSRLRAVLYENNYPKEGIDHVYIGFESQETVDRESGGNWWHHWK